MEVSKVSVAGKTYDMNYVGKKKKTNLRRKLIIEYIQSKEAGAIITTKDFQHVGQFSTAANCHTFIQRMIRDGVISRYESEKPRNYYYGVTGAIRVHKPTSDTKSDTIPDINGFIKSMKELGVKFTITIEGK